MLRLSLSKKEWNFMKKITAFDFILKNGESLHFDADDFRMMHFDHIEQYNDEQTVQNVSVFLYHNANRFESYVNEVTEGERMLPFDRIQQTCDITKIALTYDDATNEMYRIGWHADAPSNKYQTSIVHPRSGDLLITINPKKTVTQQFAEVLMP